MGKTEECSNFSVSDLTWRRYLPRMALVLSAMAHLLLLLLFRQAQSLQWDYSVVQDTGMSTSLFHVCTGCFSFTVLPKKRLTIGLALSHFQGGTVKKAPCIWADISFCTTAVAIWSFYTGLWTFDILLHPPWQVVCQGNIALRGTLATLVDGHEDHEALWKWTGGRYFLHSLTSHTITNTFSIVCSCSYPQFYSHSKLNL